MAFNELNSVEYYIIHQLSGVNLNVRGPRESVTGYGAHWDYQSSRRITKGD
jgi:type I restriction enzyme, R subunit